MKKIIALLLAVLIAFCCTSTAFGANAVEELPIILLGGDGTQIYMPDENAENGERNIWDQLFNGVEKGDIGESVANVLLPFLIEGLIFDKWDNYYDAFYDEIAPLFDPITLDNNGNPKYNTGLCKEDLNRNATDCLHNAASWQGGKYRISNYTYFYDWRIAPSEVIDDLHAYIQQVMKSTGKKQVNIVANCLGGSYILAYLQKYGTNGHIKNVFFNTTVGNGTDLLTDAYCGDIVLDQAAIQRFLNQNVEKDSSTLAGLITTSPLINEIILTSYDLLAQTHVLESLGMTFDDLYQRIYEGLVPRLAIAIFATMPGYWTVVNDDRYIEARTFVFGKEGDERYEEYKGLIAKLDDYYNNVSSKKLDIIKACQDAGVHFGATAKYGFQMYPFVKSQNQLSDQLVDLEHSSFGATVAKDVYSVLPDEHIQSAIGAGNEKYISPDKMVDASTSIFKDTLWIRKNVSHEYISKDYDLALEFCRHTNFTVESDARYPQYMILLPETMEKDPETGATDYSTGDIVPMTDENCRLTLWDDIPEETQKDEMTIGSRIIAFFRWLTAMLKFLVGIIDEKPVLGA